MTSLHNISPGAHPDDIERLVLKATTALYALAVAHDGCAEQTLAELSLAELRRLGELADALSSRAFALAAPRSEVVPEIHADPDHLPGLPPVRPAADRAALVFEVDDLADLDPLLDEDGAEGTAEGEDALW